MARYKFDHGRLYPTPDQEFWLEQYLYVTQQLYNAFLAHKRNAWEDRGHNVTAFDMSADLTQFRSGMPLLKTLPCQIEQETVRRLGRAFEAFFRRVKAGEKPGYPRFQSWRRWKSFAFQVNQKLIGCGRVFLPKIKSGIRCRGLRRIDGIPKLVYVKRVAGKWYVHIKYEVASGPVVTREPTHSVGIDVGLNHFAVLSDGTKIDNPRFGRIWARRLARAQRALARKKPGSRNREKSRRKIQIIYSKIANLRTTFTHQVGSAIARKYPIVFAEKLDIKRMVRSRYAKSILDACWGGFLLRLRHKVENTGGVFGQVDPRGTTQNCSRCGHCVPKQIWDRIHKCPYCGLVLPRDLNSAIEIEQRGHATMLPTGCAGWVTPADWSRDQRDAGTFSGERFISVIGK